MFFKHRSKLEFELEPEPPLFHSSGSSQKRRLRLHNTAVLGTEMVDFFAVVAPAKNERLQFYPWSSRLNLQLPGASSIIPVLFAVRTVLNQVKSITQALTQLLGCGPNALRGHTCVGRYFPGPAPQEVQHDFKCWKETHSMNTFYSRCLGCGSTFIFSSGLVHPHLFLTPRFVPTLKGIVLRNWAELEMISMDRSEVCSSPGSYFYFVITTFLCLNL